VNDRVTGTVGWVLALGLGALVFAQLPTVLWQDVVVPKLVVLRLLTFFLLLGIAAVTITRPSSAVRRRMPVYVAAGGLFLIWSLLSALLSGNRHLSLFGAVSRYEGWLGFAGYFVIFWAARMVARRKYVPTSAAVWAVFGAVLLISVLAITQHFWPESRKIDILALGGWQRSYATFGNPLFFGLFCALAAPVLTGIAAGWSEPRSRWLGAGVILLLMTAAIFTYSRATWVGLVAGVLVTAFLLRPRRLSGRLLALALLPLAFGLATTVDYLRPASLPGEATVQGRTSQTLEGGGTIATRLELYKGTIRLIEEKPLLGWGFETYTREAVGMRNARLIELEGPNRFADRPHNSALYMAYSSGLVGLALYVTFIGGALLAGWRGYRRRQGAEKWLSAGLLGGVIAYFIAELGSFSVVEATPLAWAALGRLAAAEGRDPQDTTLAEGERGEEPAPRPAGRGLAMGLAIAALCLAVGLPALIHAVNVARADRLLYTVAATGEHVLSDLPALAVKAEKAVQLDPYNPYTRNITALMYLDVGEQLRNPAYISRSERLFTEGLTYLPDEPNLTVGLSDLYIRVGRPEEAVRLLTDYLRLDPYMADAHFNMGLAYLNLREPAQAAKHLEDCVRIVPSDAEAFFYLGKAYEQSGEQERATAAFESAARLDPRFRDGDSSALDAS